MNDFTRRWMVPVLYLTDNWTSRIGLFLVLSAMVLWIFLTGASSANGYVGILQFVALPAAFFVGLFLVPLGIRMQRRKDGTPWPEKIELTDPKVQRSLLFLGGATLANLIIGGSLSYSAVHYMESTNFCGTACHSVMGPEFAAYQVGSHSRVKCVECHVGEGMGNAVRAKLNGTRQLALLIAGSYSRPIPSPPHRLQAAAETCEKCHSPGRDYGNKLWRHTRFDDDGSRLDTALLMKLSTIHGAHKGIHYQAADDRRASIVRVTVMKGGETREYATGASAKFERDMDCLDCHNRPAHQFENPERAVDQAMTSGRLPHALPLFRKAALDALQQNTFNGEAASAIIPGKLVAFYQKNRPDILTSNRTEIDRAGRILRTLYARNVFPEMGIQWGTYPKHIGHTDSPGCFRCHGDDLKTKTGQTISSDCETCHKVLGVDEKDLKALKELGE